MNDLRQRGTTNFGVNNPPIPRVFDAETGDRVNTDELLGTDEARPQDHRQ